MSYKDNAILKSLGMDQPITRRDFLNATLIGAGALLLDLPAPLSADKGSWDGYGGVGDYAESHGNTEAVVRAAHEIRDGAYQKITREVIDTGELFDLAVVGGGLSGLAAAYYFKKSASSRQKCLILENHPVMGGESKRNEFVVNGQRLIGPQGANSFVIPEMADVPGHDIYEELNISKKFTYQKIEPDLKTLQFDHTNFKFMLWHDSVPSVGYGFVEQGKVRWLTNIWKEKLRNTPFPERVRRDLLAWRAAKELPPRGKQYQQWLDSMPYKEYIEKVLGLSPEVTAFADPIMASSFGLGCDAISAYFASQINMPGFPYPPEMKKSEHEWHSFPGGTDAFPRFFLKALIPDAISGSKRFEDIYNGVLHFTALDRAENQIRIRLNTTAVKIMHSAAPEKSGHVTIIYTRGGKLYQVRARGVVVACGGWVVHRIVQDLPQEYREAYNSFSHSPMLVANVALTNWRFLHELGLTACRWFSGFGSFCNIRRSMTVGEYNPPLHPDKPAVLTFYLPFYYPGLPIREQGVRGRRELLATRYAEYERRIREQMQTLFRQAGFDPKRDIAGIILNRWGHAYLNPSPGFHFGKNGQLPPSQIIRKRFGRIAFAHAELKGHQHWAGAVSEAARAVQQLREVYAER